ncbi:uncharacterized protein SCDLUD_003490 [Saccharomycodes ludwigii]|uniref:uncharacterized protein n=1 Tax=Saccharomycodes ludwigii TaxID=36035 RepID=UPI001E8C356E|nr:hypothetical protein SCDLUD_003490 [Saccharomycodes ludwigii]KAH3900504.1 hypothetical protein SCDLUD_003490 [Saccharomycodes ludwigii]
MNDQYQHCNQQLAIDPVTIVIRECITLATAMRKFTKYYSQSTNVAALLTGTNSNNEDKHAELFSNYKNFTGILDSEISRFNDKKEQDTTTATEEEAEQTSISTETSTTIKKNSPANNSGLLNSNTFVNNDPLLAGFLQLRTMLNSKVSLQNIDALTLLQPFLLVISTSTTSGYITNLALTSLQKFFFQYKIINTYSKNYQAAFKQSVVSLTHCRFEGSEQLSDDSVLLKVLELMRNLVTSEQYNTIMSDSIMYEVLQTVMSLACNKRRSEVLRRAAEMTMMEITSTLFMKLKTINSSSQNAYINDEDYTKNGLKDDTIGTSSDTKEIIEKEDTEENNPTGSTKEDTGKEEIYGLPVIKDYLGILISLIMPENQHKHNYSTRILSLQLLNIAFEISGDHFPHHPVLFTLVSDPIFKNILYIIKNAKNTKPSLLQAALQAFVTLSLVMGEYLEMQIELTLKTIFDIVSDSDDDQVASVAKELLIEQIAILWTRSKPSFFTKLFVTYDCNLNRSDLCVDFIKYLSKLSLPESASTTADIVPPICLNGLISFIEDTYVLLTGNMGCNLDIANTYLEQRERKAKFIESTQLFNEKPKKGLPLLLSNGFIENDNEETIAKFLYENKGRLNKKTIGEYVADPKNISLLKHFISNFNFQGLRVDEAIRVLLTKFRLPGESQQIERIVESFAAKYVEDQKYDSDRETINEVEDDYATVQPDADSVFILSYSIIMLNTDLHNPQVKKHMTFDDYTYNLKGCNNNKNFPLWYLDRIYCSIRDKEIVMPEEHHGNEEWFDDAWNNLISSFNVYIEYKDTHSNSQELTDVNSLIQFDRAIFEQAGENIISTLFKIFEIATDDHISIKMLSTLDKCCYIAFTFGSANALNTVIKKLISISLLDGEFNEESESDNIPLVEILEDERNKKVSYSVSNLGVKFGRDFKAQLVTILLFNIFQNNNRLGLISEDSWFSLAQIVLNLYENKIMLPDCFPSIQKKFRLPPLPRPTPDYTINKSQKESNNRNGLLSTFASYLKGDEEPTLQELNASLSTYQCIATCNLQETLLGNKYNFTDGKFIMAVLKLLDGNRVLAEGTKLFLIEFMVGLFFNHLETTHVASSRGGSTMHC